jgi:hypothetical protein
MMVLLGCDLIVSQGAPVHQRSVNCGPSSAFDSHNYLFTISCDQLYCIKAELYSWDRGYIAWKV